MVPEFADRQQIPRFVKQNESFLRRWIGLATIQHIDIDAFTAQYFKEPEMWSSSLLLCLLLQNGTTPLVQDLLARIEALEKREQPGCRKMQVCRSTRPCTLMGLRM